MSKRVLLIELKAHFWWNHVSETTIAVICNDHSFPTTIHYVNITKFALHIENIVGQYNSYCSKFSLKRMEYIEHVYLEQLPVL